MLRLLRQVAMLLLGLMLPVLSAGAEVPDFSGHWELDYQRSEDIRQKTERLYQQAKSDYDRAMDKTRDSYRTRGGRIYLEPGMSNYRSIVGLGGLAEKITQATLLDIQQTEGLIIIKRNEDYSLICDFTALKPRQSPAGREACGWLDHQLAFRIDLAEGLRVSHLLTMAPSGRALAIATTVKLSGLRWPFTVQRLFTPYKPSKGRFHCEFTLAKQQTCTLLGKEAE